MEEGGEGRGDREEGARRMCAAISLDACGCWMGVHGQDLTVLSVDCFFSLWIGVCSVATHRSASPGNSVQMVLMEAGTRARCVLPASSLEQVRLVCLCASSA